MAYSIGPKFNNAFDANNIATIYLEGDKVIDERNRKNFDNMMAGFKGIGKGIGAARQYVEADKIKQANLEKLKQLQALRDAANDELVGLNAMRDEAKGTVFGIDNMLANMPKIEGGPYPFSNAEDLAAADRARIMPYKAPKEPGPLNYGEEDYTDRFNLGMFGRKAGL
jgi:hypothetical protein